MNTIFFLLYALSIVAIIALGNCNIILYFTGTDLSDGEFNFILMMVVTLMELIGSFVLMGKKKPLPDSVLPVKKKSSSIILTGVIITILLMTMFSGYHRLFELIFKPGFGWLVTSILIAGCMALHLVLIMFWTPDTELNSKANK